MSTGSLKERKQATYDKAVEALKAYNKVLIVSLDSIISTQLKDIKRSWKANAEIINGKKSSIRRAAKDLNLCKFADFENKLRGNVCPVFFNCDVKQIKECIDDNVRHSVAKVGDVSQKDIWIKAQVTTMGPEKTSYFQALGIPTKITKGKIEITQDVLVCATGELVGPSQANLLALLDVKPFSYKLNMLAICEDGVFYDPAIIEISKDDIKNIFSRVVCDVARMSLGANVITQASVPYEIGKAFKEVLKVSYGADFYIKESPFPAN